MKRRTFFLLACVALAASLQSAYAGDDTKTISTYYGSEASNNSRNPCKGATIRKCGVIETSYSAIEKKQYKTTSTYYGSETSNSSKNPCKGATIGKCGVIETSYSAIEKNQYGTVYEVETLVKDPHGVVIKSDNKQMTVPVNTTLQEFVKAN